MADSRTKNATRNIAFGSINKFVSLVLPFITRTMVLHLLGKQYLGIGTLFTSILSFLSITDLGLGSAIVYTMYKPIANNDTDRICALLKYYKTLYRIIGLAILIIGTVLVPFLPQLMNGEAPEGLNIYVLYYIYLFNSVISYFFFGYKQSLLIAHQRSDIKNNIHTIINLFTQFGKIYVLYFTRDFYAYAFVPIIGTIITNISVAVITAKKYPDYVDCGTVDVEVKQEIKKKVSGLFGTKLNTIVTHSTDVMIISAFLGLTMTAKYGNYYYIMNAVCGFVNVFFASLVASIGNKLVTDTVNENYKLFKNLIFANSWIIGWASITFVCLFEPFMKLWVGADMQLGIGFVLLFSGYFFVYEIQRPIFAFKDALGLWHKDMLRPYVSMAINLVLNIVLVQFIGVYGIVISTMLSFLLTLPWLNSILYKNLFVGIKPGENLLRLLTYLFITILVGVVTYIPCRYLGDSYLAFFARMAICVIVPNVIFFALYCKRPEFKYFSKKVKKLLKIR